MTSNSKFKSRLKKKLKIIKQARQKNIRLGRSFISRNERLAVHLKVNLDSGVFLTNTMVNQVLRGRCFI